MKNSRKTRIVLSIAGACVAVSLICCHGCRGTVDTETALKVQAAQQVFDQAQSPEDYAKSAAMFQEIIDRQCPSGAALYNLGNAWMRAEQPGRAVAAYRQAARYLPRNPYLENNLAVARGLDAPTASRPIIETVLFWQNWLSYPEKFYFAAAAALATFVVAAAGLFAARRPMKRITWVGIIITGVLVFSAAYDWNRFDNTLHGVVIVPQTVARTGYAASYEPAFKNELPEGTEFEVLRRRGNWLFVRLPGGGEGWIEEKDAVTY
ncbi:MAG: hypothetical protein JW959_06710 [Pirellulales bacterium]|nr:hypothetical protein [Pirellulales bacterium]